MEHMSVQSVAEAMIKAAHSAPSAAPAPKAAVVDLTKAAELAHQLRVLASEEAPVVKQAGSALQEKMAGLAVPLSKEERQLTSILSRLTGLEKSAASVTKVAECGCKGDTCKHRSKGKAKLAEMAKACKDGGKGPC